MVAYALAKHPPRKPKRLFEQRANMLKSIEKEFKEKFGKVKLR
jgi:hypothetical protein